MAMFNVLRWFHPMIGCDFHIPVLPPGPLPFPSPYFVIHIMGNPISLTKLYTTTVFADSKQPAMVKGTDIGMLIPHFGTFSLTMAIEMLFSGSKSHFGPASVNVADQYGAAGNPAVACICKVNVNLNCGFPIPTPVDIVAAFNTTAVEMTWADILAGLYSMLVDFAFQALMNWFGYKYMGYLNKGFQKLFNRLGPKLGIHFLTKQGAKTAALRRAWRAAMRRGYPHSLNQYARDFAKSAGRNLNPVTRLIDRYFALAGEKAVAFFIGSPLGTASDAPALGGPSAHGWTRKKAESMGLPSEKDMHDLFSGWFGNEPIGGGAHPSPKGNPPSPAPSPVPVPAPSPVPVPAPSPSGTATPSPSASAVPSPNANGRPPSSPVSDYLNDPAAEEL